MNILQVNTYDVGGGAEKIAMDLQRFYMSLGLDSKLMVGQTKTNLSSVYEIPPTRWFQFWNDVDKMLVKSHLKGSYRLHNLVKQIKAPHYKHARKLGEENYHYPESRRLVTKLSDGVDVIHMHNLHTEYFDLRILPSVSKKKPTLITMHDEYLFTGHCASTLGCERWRIGCGECPHLDIYPAVNTDNTRYNWSRKRKIFSKSQLTLVTPSIWLAHRARESLLSPLPVKVIPNGIDLNIFKPSSQAIACTELGLDQDAFIILYTAAGGRNNPFKDYDMMDRVIARLQKQTFNKPVILMALGGGQSRKAVINGVSMIEKPFENNPKHVAKHYQACDLYIHTAKADNAPLVILEAMACGKPIVATNAGGIPELVREGETGHTVPIGDDQAMTEKIINLINDPDRLRQFGENAARIAKENYGLDRMVNNYLVLYQELIDGKQ
jgi:glycosyltransferase involved in cell wall biosynthesis